MVVHGIVRAGFAEVVSAEEFALDAPRCAKAESGKVDVLDDFSEEPVRNLYALLHSLPYAQDPNLLKREKAWSLFHQYRCSKYNLLWKKFLRSLTWTV